MKLLVFVLLAAMLMPGCGSVPATPATPAARAISVEALLEGSPLAKQGGAMVLPESEVLTLDAPMLAFVDRVVDTKQPDSIRLRQLVEAIMDEDTFRLEYDTKTRTAAETFHDRRGNCLSFTNMFVAMARHVGLEASFQEVDIPPDWTVMGGAFTLNRHVNVLVDLKRADEYLVDFNFDDFRTSYDRRRVADYRALAHYHNNVGVEQMVAGQNGKALLHYRKAIEVDREFGYAWANLGTLYRRTGYYDYAEAAYLEALRINPGDLVSMSNLAAMHKQQGDIERADLYRQRVNDHRNRNPYYRYSLALQAFKAENYDSAIEHLKYAVRKKKNEDTFYFLMGMSYLKKGEEAVARQWLEKGEQVAEDDERQRRYGAKLEKLFSPHE